MSARGHGGAGSGVTGTKRCGGWEKEHWGGFMALHGVQFHLLSWKVLLTNQWQSCFWCWLCFLTLMMRRVCRAGVTPSHQYKVLPKQPSCLLTNDPCNFSLCFFYSGFSTDLSLSHFCLFLISDSNSSDVSMLSLLYCKNPWFLSFFLAGFLKGCLNSMSSFDIYSQAA